MRQIDADALKVRFVPEQCYFTEAILNKIDTAPTIEPQAARLMTLEEAIEAVSKKGGFVWIEQKSHPLCDAHVSPSNSIFDCPSRKFKDYGKRFIPKKNSFRFMWRCWTSWPTDEQREDTKWDE